MKACAPTQATMYLPLSMTSGLAQATCGDFCTKEFWETSKPTKRAQAIRDVDVRSITDYVLTPIHAVVGRRNLESIRSLISSEAYVPP